MTTKITAAHVEAALIARYPANAYAIAFEVANATGAAASRAADCVAMSCWPSRGLSVIGHEIKVSRSDWVKERDTPAKADAIARYCDEWWLCVSDAKIVQPGELPPTWGLLVMQGDKLVQREAARQPLSPIPLDRQFVAAFLRAVSKPQRQSMDQMLWKARCEGEQRERERSAIEIERLKKQERDVALKIHRFTEESGINPLADEWRYRGTSVAKAVEIVRNGLPDLAEKIDDLRRLARRCEEAAQEFEAVAKANAEMKEASHA